MKYARSSELREALLALSPFFRRAAWFSLCSSLLVLAPSGYMLEVYDRVVNSRNHLTLAMLTLLVLGAYVVMELLEWARGDLMHKAGHELDRKMSPRIFDAIFVANLRRHQGGSMALMNDFKTVREFLTLPVVTALMEAPSSLVFLVLIFFISPVLGYVALVGAVIQVAVGWFNEKATQPALVAANRSASLAQLYADNTLRNAQVIESMGMLKDIHRRWIDKQREFLGLQALASERAGSYQAIMKLLQLVMSSLLLGLGAYLLLNRELNGGASMMIVASILGGRILAPLVQIVANWRPVVNFRDAWTRLDDLLTVVPPKSEAMALPPPKGMLQVEALSAGAPGGSAPILKNVQFALRPGEVLGVIGPSASGKTTLARLLVGLWPALTGKVRLDGADVFTWDKSELGPHVGYLPQGIELFEGTLAENIARFGEVAPAKIEAAARAVGLHDYIMELPQGYDSPVGREGAMLSGGQRQRVGLARAIYGDPAFVVLDEPNSSLDEAGDAALAAAILELKARGTTFVVMTHRTSVLAVVDKLLVLNDGIAQAFGPRDDVLAALKRAAEQAQQAAQQAKPARDAESPARPAAATAG
jgi:ATP-binding cassette, subfamily C, bacterial exporter for protease/lipase